MNKKPSGKAPILYIIIPCYNEEEVLPITAPLFFDKLNRLIRLEMISDDSRIMFINDGSSDSTWELICSLAESDPHYIGIAQSRNRGHQNAVLAGLMEAKDRCDVTISIDCDGQDDINAMDGAELEGAANHITIKRGKGSHKNDYIMTINNIPYNYLDGQPVSNSRHYLRAVVLSVYGQDQKSAGNICIDKVSVKRAKKTVLNYTFDSKKGMPKDVSAICNNKSVKGIDIVGL